MNLPSICSVDNRLDTQYSTVTVMNYRNDIMVVFLAHNEENLGGGGWGVERAVHY